MHVVVAPDKFRGTASASAVAQAVGEVAATLGWTSSLIPLSDGGEGLLDVFGGPNHFTDVTGPDGRPVRAGWWQEGASAVIECALASGLALVGGSEGNDAVRATSRGTGELVLAALEAGATDIVVGLGGSACSDGGIGALEALGYARQDARITVCCDVQTRYLDAAVVFGPQKGATPTEVEQLTRGLEAARELLRGRLGVDPQEIPGSGAAGGLGGALAAIGGVLTPGFDFVAGRVGLDQAIAAADLVVTGEGRLDPSSLDGKVVGGVARMAARHGVSVTAIVGTRDAGLDTGFPVVSLTGRFGLERALADVIGCLHDAAADVLGAQR